MASPPQLFWALVGLLLTIGGTLIEGFIAGPSLQWGQVGVALYSLGVSFQIGAVLLVGCLGGRNAAIISQIAYLVLGLTWFNVFAQGGGFDYIYRPTFGYLLGFVPGAWICGTLAFRFAAKLEYLALSCLAALMTIHASGIAYLVVANQLNWSIAGSTTPSLTQTLLNYSLYPLPGQLAIVCAVTVVAFILRHLMFY